MHLILCYKYEPEVHRPFYYLSFLSIRLVWRPLLTGTVIIRVLLIWVILTLILQETNLAPPHQFTAQHSLAISYSSSSCLFRRTLTLK